MSALHQFCIQNVRPRLLVAGLMHGNGSLLELSSCSLFYSREVGHVRHSTRMNRQPLAKAYDHRRTFCRHQRTQEPDGHQGGESTIIARDVRNKGFAEGAVPCMVCPDIPAGRGWWDGSGRGRPCSMNWEQGRTDLRGVVQPMVCLTIFSSSSRSNGLVRLATAFWIAYWFAGNPLMTMIGIFFNSGFWDSFR